MHLTRSLFVIVLKVLTYKKKNICIIPWQNNLRAVIDDDDDYSGFTFVSHRSPSGDVGMDQTHEHKMSFEGAEGRPGETDKHWHSRICLKTSLEDWIPLQTDRTMKLLWIQGIK